MKKLIDLEVIINETFYKGWPILDYIEKHNLTKLDKEAIKATIMDVLVYKNIINPEQEYLNLEELTITNNPSDYHYNKTPNVSGIPAYIKEQLRHISIHQSGGIPVMLFIAKPPSKVHFCVYDPNYCVSAIFEDATFLECIYDSPTRPGISQDFRVNHSAAENFNPALALAHRAALSAAVEAGNVNFA